MLDELLREFRVLEVGWIAVAAFVTIWFFGTATAFSAFKVKQVIIGSSLALILVILTGVGVSGWQGSLAGRASDALETSYGIELNSDAAYDLLNEKAVDIRVDESIVAIELRELSNGEYVLVEQGTSQELEPIK